MTNSLLENILRDDEIVSYLQHMVRMKCELNYQVLGELDRHFRGITSRGGVAPQPISRDEISTGE